MMGIRPEVTWITWLFTLGLPAVIFILAWLISGGVNRHHSRCNSKSDNNQSDDIEEGFF